MAKGIRPDAVREKLLIEGSGSVSTRVTGKPHEGAVDVLNDVLAGLKSSSSEILVSCFAEDAHVIDATGKRWNRVRSRRDSIPCLLLTPRKMLPALWRTQV